MFQEWTEQKLQKFTAAQAQAQAEAQSQEITAGGLTLAPQAPP